jgi:cation diffusion facilitator CzcD-associated flavoprotein CzcO
VSKWNLDRDVKFNHKVISTICQEDLGHWKVSIESGREKLAEYADTLVSAQGVLKWVSVEFMDLELTQLDIGLHLFLSSRN